MINKAINKITSGFTIISAVIFLIIVLVVIANIVGRAVFNSPINGTVEIVQYGMLFCVGIVMCRSGYEERHITVTVLIDHYPVRIRALFVALGKLISTVVFGMITILFARQIPQALLSGKVTDTFRISFEYVYLMMVICFATGALIFFFQFCVATNTVITGKKAPEKTSNTIETGEGSTEL